MATRDLSAKGLRDDVAANAAAIAAAGGVSVATLTIAAGGMTLDAGDKTLTISVGDDSAVITFDDIGVAISRSGALAVTAGMGGGLVADPASIAQVIWYAIALMIDGSDFTVKPVVSFQSLAQDDFSPGNPLAAYTKLSVMAGADVSFTIGAGITAGLTVDP